MEITINNSFEQISFSEMFEIDGGFDADSFFTGLGILGASLFAIVSLPETALVGVLYGVCCVASAATGAASGYFLGKGIAN